jgi:hypothetical protein
MANSLGNAGGLGSIAQSLGGDLTGTSEGLGNITNNIGNAAATAVSPAQLAVQAAQKRAAALQLNQSGGARRDELSNESLILGGAVAAIVGAGALKMAVDYMIPL